MPYTASVPSQLLGIPSGVAGIRATLAAMVRFARDGQKKIPIIDKARQILLIARVPEKDYAGELTALQHFVRDRVRYTRDPDGAEMVQTPQRTLEVCMGDCDDKATLLAALAGAVGFPTRFAALAFGGGPISHVLVEARLGTRWIPCETIMADKEPGWYPANVTDRIERNV